MYAVALADVHGVGGCHLTLTSCCFPSEFRSFSSCPSSTLSAVINTKSCPSSFQVALAVVSFDPDRTPIFDFVMPGDPPGGDAVSSSPSTRPAMMSLVGDDGTGRGGLTSMVNNRRRGVVPRINSTVYMAGCVSTGVASKSLGVL